MQFLPPKTDLYKVKYVKPNFPSQVFVWHCLAKNQEEARALFYKTKLISHNATIVSVEAR